MQLRLTDAESAAAVADARPALGEAVSAGAGLLAAAVAAASPAFADVVGEPDFSNPIQLVATYVVLPGVAVTDVPLLALTVPFESASAVAGRTVLDDVDASPRSVSAGE